jgi:hypothetical protein
MVDHASSSYEEKVSDIAKDFISLEKETYFDNWLLSLTSADSTVKCSSMITALDKVNCMLDAYNTET